MSGNAQVRCLTTMLKCALKGENIPQPQLEQIMQGVDEEQLYALARAHAVAPLVYEAWSEYPGTLPAVQKELQAYTMQIIGHSYRLLFYTKYLVGLLEQENLTVAVLKGVATAECYPQPELRKAGDVDLLFFSKEDCERAVVCLKRHGFVEHEEKLHLHHVAMLGAEGIEVELHSMMVEPFDHEQTNRVMMQCQQEAKAHVQRQLCMGVPLPVLTGAYHGFSLLLHLLQHFLTAGFGLKLLCDWVVFWEKQPPEVIGEEIGLIRAMKVEQFVAAVSGVCVRELGMDQKVAEPFLALGDPVVKEGAYLDQFFMDIVEAEEFGKSQKGRMLAIHDQGLSGYVRAFHHQMHLNYPKAGKCVFFWPVLWLFTLGRFLRNNRTIRKTTVKEILKSAGKRGKIVEKMHLFE
ncbi:MAG: nucleotidyltransferase family protein [Lachnospiraceae bacterium]|nr:nucleotidyltransferase family protein [bacterium]MDY5517402.1 nucleotidyltransferase family protein [Lachnospiraceae bacterium]